MSYQPDNPDIPDFSGEVHAPANNMPTQPTQSGETSFTNPVSYKPVSSSAPGKSSPHSPSMPSMPINSQATTQTDSTTLLDQELIALKNKEQQLESERNALAEKKRRKNEYHQGRKEMEENFTRGMGLLEEEIIRTKRSVNLMENTYKVFSEMQGKVQCLNEEDWEKERYDSELSKALTVLENARMEWNTALINIPILDRSKKKTTSAKNDSLYENSSRGLLDMPSGEIMKMSIWLFWPMLLIAFILLLIFIALII